MPQQSLAEVQKELGYTLKDFQDRLKHHGSLDAAAASYDLSPGTFRRYFGRLANAGGRKMRTPEDFLAGKTTQRGGSRREPGPPTRSWSARLSEETIELLESAIARVGKDVSRDAAMRAIAETFLRDPPAANDRAAA